MHRIRDLGINVLPATVRPLEIGLFACHGVSEGGSQTCTNGTCPEPPGPQCTEESRGSVGCGDITCVDECEEARGASRKPSPHPRYAGAFSPHAIAQLKQQLETRITGELYT